MIIILFILNLLDFNNFKFIQLYSLNIINIYLNRECNNLHPIIITITV
jgi:hypothetical protein